MGSVERVCLPELKNVAFNTMPKEKQVISISKRVLLMDTAISLVRQNANRAQCLLITDKGVR